MRLFIARKACIRADEPIPPPTYFSPKKKKEKKEKIIVSEVKPITDVSREY